MSSFVPISAIDVLVLNLDYAFDKVAWHGPNLMGALRGVDARKARVRVRARRCIWEQALHCAYWKQRVVNKVAGTQRFPRIGSNWPKIPSFTSAELWRRDLQLLRELHISLRSAVLRIDAAELDAS